MINWLPTSKRVDQCKNTTTYNFINNICSYYLNEFFEFAPHTKIDTSNNFAELKNIFRKIGYWFLYMEQLDWLIYKKVNSLKTLKRNIKKHYSSWIINNVCMCICVSACIYVCVSMGVCIYTHMDINVCVFLWIVHCHVFLFFFFFSHLHFSYSHSDLRDHNEDKAFLTILCYSLLMLFMFVSSNILTSPFIFYIFNQAAFFT